MITNNKFNEHQYRILHTSFHKNNRTILQSMKNQQINKTQEDSENNETNLSQRVDTLCPWDIEEETSPNFDENTLSPKYINEEPSFSKQSKLEKQNHISCSEEDCLSFHHQKSFPKMNSIQKHQQFNHCDSMEETFLKQIIVFPTQSNTNKIRSGSCFVGRGRKGNEYQEVSQHSKQNQDVSSSSASVTEKDNIIIKQELSKNNVNFDGDVSSLINQNKKSSDHRLALDLQTKSFNSQQVFGKVFNFLTAITDSCLKELPKSTSTHSNAFVPIKNSNMHLYSLYEKQRYKAREKKYESSNSYLKKQFDNNEYQQKENGQSPSKKLIILGETELQNDQQPESEGNVFIFNALKWKKKQIKSSPKSPLNKILGLSNSIDKSQNREKKIKNIQIIDKPESALLKEKEDIHKPDLYLIKKEQLIKRYSNSVTKQRNQKKITEDDESSQQIEENAKSNSKSDNISVIYNFEFSPHKTLRDGDSRELQGKIQEFLMKQQKKQLERINTTELSGKQLEFNNKNEKEEEERKKNKYITKQLKIKTKSIFNSREDKNQQLFPSEILSYLTSTSTRKQNFSFLENTSSGNARKGQHEDNQVQTKSSTEQLLSTTAHQRDHPDSFTLKSINDHILPKIKKNEKQLFCFKKKNLSPSISSLVNTFTNKNEDLSKSFCFSNKKQQIQSLSPSRVNPKLIWKPKGDFQ